MRKRYGILAVLFLLWGGAAAHANSVTVGCSGSSGTFDYNSINAAVSALGTISHLGHQITVSGICTERVSLVNFENLTIIGSSGAILQSPDGNLALEVIQTRNLIVRGLTIRGTGTTPYLVIVANSLAQFDQCIFDGEGGRNGIFLSEGGSVKVLRSTIQNNKGNAIRVSQGSYFDLGSLNPGDDATTVTNNGVGIRVDEGGHLSIFGATYVQNNASIGVLAEGGSLRFCCGGDPRKILNNRMGIMVNYGTIDMIGPAQIEDNQIVGLQLEGSSGELFGEQVFRGNGNGGNRFARGAIIVRGNSHLVVSGVQVLYNSGGGITMRDTSSASLFDNVVTGNTGGGVNLILQSTALFNGNRISGNGNADLACSPDSLGYGDNSGIGRAFCSRFSVEPVEGRGP